MIVRTWVIFVAALDADTILAVGTGFAVRVPGADRGRALPFLAARLSASTIEQGIDRRVDGDSLADLLEVAAILSRSRTI